MISVSSCKLLVVKKREHKQFTDFDGSHMNHLTQPRVTAKRKIIGSRDD